jgi:hypothetical protein
MKRLLMIVGIGCVAGAANVAPADKKFSPVDLHPYTNRKLVDNLGSGFEGNSLTELPAGEQVFGGVKFKVGEGLIQVGSKMLGKWPERVEGIKVERKLAKLHILHATCFGGGPNHPGDPGFVEDGTLIGEFRVNFQDRSAIIIPIVYGQDVRDWFYVQGEKDPSRGKVGWTGDNEMAKQAGARLRLYVTTWENPRPDKTVMTIDYLSKKAETVAAPFCVAITAEKPLKARAVAGPVTAADLEQLWKQLASDDNQASDAIETLAGMPKQAIPFLSARLRAVQAAAVEKRIALLITQLDDKDVSVRENATTELEKLGPEALPQLRSALVKATWLKVRHRIEPLVEKLETAELTADQTRLQRSLLVFELIATVEARQVLEDVAKGSAGAWLAPEARASLKRLKKTEG